LQKRQVRVCNALFDDQRIQSISSAAANLFPLWLIVAALAAIAWPQLFLWFQKDYVTAGLALTMLTMGTSLTLEVIPIYTAL
jgi:predicted Na+-dependent transporter